MKHSLLRLMLLLLSLALLLSGCGIKNKSQTILYDLPAAPKNLDPQTAADRASLLVIHNIFEGLYRLAPDGSVEPAVAEALPQISADGLTYTITLREDAVWSNGSPVTADDFVFALQRLVLPETRSPGAASFTCLASAAEILAGQAAPETLGAKAVSDRVLELRLTTPNSGLLYSLTTGYAMPCNAAFFYGTKGKYGLQASKILENGPFRVSRWTEDDLLRLDRNETYRQADRVKPSAVQLTANPEGTPAERLASLKTMAAFLDEAALAGLDAKDVTAEPLTRTVWAVSLNQKKKVTGNPDIRRALASCFDRSVYAPLLTGDRAPAYALVPPALYLCTERYRAGASDRLVPAFLPNEGQQSYTEGLAALQRDKLPALTMLLPEGTDPDAIVCFSHAAQVWQRELAVYVNLEMVDAAAYRQRVAAGDFDLLLTPLSAATDSVGQFLAAFDAGNSLGFSDESYQALLAEAAAAEDTATALGCYRRAETMLLEQAILLPMFYVTDYFAVSSRVSGLLYHPIIGVPLFQNAVLR